MHMVNISINTFVMENRYQGHLYPTMIKNITAGSCKERVRGSTNDKGKGYVIVTIQNKDFSFGRSNIMLTCLGLMVGARV